MAVSDAIRMLGMTTRVEVVSNPSLVADVVVRQRDLVATKRGLPQKNRVAVAQGIHGELTARPVAAMLELARGTALSDDPEIAAVARRWSILRYLGLFALNPATRRLHLDKGALQYVGPNQRRVLSEELGIGFGIVVAKAWCRARNPSVGPITAIDVDRALYSGQVPNLRRMGDRQPDYVLSYADPAHPNVRVFELLETKGTVSEANARGQLARAVTQLAGLTVNGRAMTGIATATVSNRDSVTVMAVDPEETPVTWNLSDEEVDYVRTIKRRPRQDVRKLDVDANEFFASATNVDNASLAEYSGQYDAATAWLPARARRRSGRGNASAQRETEAGTFVGVEYLIEVGDGSRVRLFQGVERSVAKELIGGNASAVADAQQSFVRTGPDRELDSESDGNHGRASAAAVASDGSYLEIASD